MSKQAIRYVKGQIKKNDSQLVDTRKELLPKLANAERALKQEKVNILQAATKQARLRKLLHQKQEEIAALKAKADR